MFIAASAHIGVDWFDVWADVWYDVYCSYTLTSSLLQSIRLQREPYETEIIEEVEKEYARLEAERLGEEQGTEKNIADMATRMDELEAKLDASHDRLEKKIDASQSRLEAMLQQLLASRAPTSCTPPVSPRHNDGVAVSVLLPIVGDGPRNKAKEKEVVDRSELTMQVPEHVAHSVGTEVCAEEAAKEMEKDTTPSPGVDTATIGAGPSSIVGPEIPEQVG